ncbi:hypothetical protein AB0L57_18535 [Nocardia sp. NPDC052254]|uniref:hypothetical protein n=1 Tax=Nocardia sp. NPDC052254 TaxID=3155681 RepID=UPI00342CC3BC
MSTSVATTTAPDTTGGSIRTLRNLYYVRFGFAIAWAVSMMVVAETIDAGTVVLLVIYPLFDLAAAVVDFRSAGATRARAPLYINMGSSLLTTVGLGFAVGSGIPDVLRVWGFWAITAGLVQLIVAVLRYRLGGQWAMILSGGISVLAGSSFVLMAGAADASLTTIAGYAALGGVFFLISAIRLHRTTAKAADHSAIA